MFTAGLVSERVPFIVCALGRNVDPFTLHICAALAEQERRTYWETSSEYFNAAETAKPIDMLEGAARNIWEEHWRADLPKKV